MTFPAYWYTLGIRRQPLVNSGHVVGSYAIILAIVPERIKKHNALMPFDSLMFPLSLAILTHSKSSALPPCVIASRSTLVPFDIKELKSIEAGITLAKFRLRLFSSFITRSSYPKYTSKKSEVPIAYYTLLLRINMYFCSSCFKNPFCRHYTLLLETTICICNTLQFF